MAVPKKKEAPEVYVHQPFPMHVYGRTADNKIVQIEVRDKKAFDDAMKQGYAESPAELPEIDAAEVEASKDARIAELEAALEAATNAKPAKAAKGAKPADSE